jgi:hypothetical protein
MTLPRTYLRVLTLLTMVTVIVALVPTNALRSAQAGTRGCDVVVRSGWALHRAAARRAKGAVICIRGTVYLRSEVRPKDKQVFRGPGKVRARQGAEEGFYLDKARGVTIRGLDIAGFRLRAIKCGRNAKILENHLHKNRRNGVGGGNCSGVLIKGNEIERNGDRVHVGRGSAGIKLAGDSDGTLVVANHIHHNIGNGLWWDADAKHAVAARNRIVGNSRKGIHYEVSSGPAVFRYNVVRHNNWSKHRNSAGIMVEGSQRVRIFGNRLGGNNYGGVKVQSGRGFELRDVWVRQNRLNGDDVRCQEGINVVCQP